MVTPRLEHVPKPLKEETISAIGFRMETARIGALATIPSHEFSRPTFPQWCHIYGILVRNAHLTYAILPYNGIAILKFPSVGHDIVVNGYNTAR